MPTDSEFDALQVQVEALTAIYSGNIAVDEKAHLESHFDVDLIPLEGGASTLQTRTEAIVSKLNSLTGAISRRLLKEFENFSNDDNTVSQDLKKALGSIPKFKRNPWGKAWGTLWGVINTAQWGEAWGASWITPRYLTDSDPVLSDLRAPLPHQGTHQKGGSDYITHDFLEGAEPIDHKTIDEKLEELFSRISALNEKIIILGAKHDAFILGNLTSSNYPPQQSHWGMSWGLEWSSLPQENQWPHTWGEVWGDPEIISWGQPWGFSYNFIGEGLKWPHPWGINYDGIFPVYPEDQEPAPAPVEYC